MLTKPNQPQAEGQEAPLFSPNPDQLVIYQAAIPLTLTNAICENAWGSPELFALLGLEAGSWQDEFYPLTTAEENFISDDVVFGPQAWAYLGYSVVYLGQKWLAPTMELDFPKEGQAPQDGEYESPEQALEIATQIQNRLEVVFTEFGGQILLNQFTSDTRHELLFLVPFDHAQTFGSLEAWKDEIKRLLSL